MTNRKCVRAAIGMDAGMNGSIVAAGNALVQEQDKDKKGFSYHDKTFK